MKLVAPLDLALHRPLRIGEGESESGPRLGGRAPALDFTGIPSHHQYVLTFPFLESPEVFASVFVSTKPDFWDAMNEGVQSDERVIVVRHAAVPRGRTDRFASELSAHPLIVSPSLTADVELTRDGDSLVSSWHKLGGRPYCIQEPELVGAQVLFDAGFVQALQLDFPGGDDEGTVDGDWPFGDGLFNLFLKPDAPGLVYWALQK